MDEKKTFAYRLGQALAVVVILCAMTILVGGTVAFLMRIF